MNDILVDSDIKSCVDLLRNSETSEVRVAMFEINNCLGPDLEMVPWGLVCGKTTQIIVFGDKL